MTREEARKYIIRHCNPDYPKASRTQWDAAINLAISALEQPEIVRCEFCKHWTRKALKECGLGRCDFHDADLVTCNGYCYWAEGREE